MVIKALKCGAAVLFAAALTFGMVSCKQEGDDVSVYTDTTNNYSYAYNLSNGKIKTTNSSGLYTVNQYKPATIFWTTDDKTSTNTRSYTVDLSNLYFFADSSDSATYLQSITITKYGSKYYYGARNVTDYISGGLEGGAITFTSLPIYLTSTTSTDYLTLTLTRM